MVGYAEEMTNSPGDIEFRLKYHFNRGRERLVGLLRENEWFSEKMNGPEEEKIGGRMGWDSLSRCGADV